MKKEHLRMQMLLAALFFVLLSPILYSQTSIFTSQVPANSGNDSDYELGLKFSSTTTARISHVRFYKMPGESSSHTATLWTGGGAVIATASFIGETASGWQYASFASPILISANTTYVVSVNVASVYAIEQHQLDNPITNGFLTALAGGGVFNETVGLFPTQSYNNSNYFVDVVANELNSIFTTQFPVGQFNDGPYEMGVKFTASQAAKVKMFSYYRTAGETGSHTGNLWSSTGTLLASAAFVNETTSDWQYAELSSNVYIIPGNTYVVTVNSNSEYGAGGAQSLGSSVTNGILSTVADNNNGVYGSPGVFPTSSFNNNNYFRDILVEPLTTPAMPALVSPADNAGGTSIELELNWSAVSGATYSLQVATDIAFSNLIVNATDLATNSYNLTNLSNGIAYYWRVSAEQEILSSGFSTPFTFTTIAYSQVLLSWPIGGVSIYMSPASFSWYVPSGGTGWKYDLLYSTDVNMTSPAVISNINSVPYSLNGLLPGTTYFWKIRLKTSSGVVVSYSDQESFISFGQAFTPVLSSPINDDTINTLSPTLYWYLNDASTGLTYDLEIRQGTPAALTGTATVTNISTQYYTVAGLQQGTQYSWQVRSKSGSNYSAWSDAETFNTVATPGPVVPIPSWPVGNAIVYATSPSLNWYLGTAGTGLVFEVEYVEGLVTAFTGTPNILNINSLSTNLSNLIPDSDYKWRVRSFDGATYSAWSTTAIFSIIGSVSNAPVIPFPSWPVGGATVYSNSVQLNWYLGASGNGLTYEVELRTGSLNGTPTILGISALNTTVNALTPSTTYFWRVRSTNGITTSCWSATESFQTIGTTATVTVPVLSWPIGGATVYTNSPMLSWFLNSSSVGITFELKYSTNSNMTGATTISNLATNQITLSGLNSGTTYYWQVRSFDGTVYSAFSAAESFVTFAGNSLLVVPVAASPAEGISIESSSAMLSWFLPTAGEAAKYELQYSKNSEMQNATNLEMNSNRKLINGLENGKTYYWRVRSINENGEASAYSSIEKFTPTSNITGVAEQKEIPTEFKLEQNFPNPFNPTTTLSFSIPVEGFYNLDIFNILGEKVASLQNGFLNPGVFKSTFDAKNLSSGVYFYKLYGNNVNLVRKMMLIK